ncbi:BZ3500_MvSof-1268-A1-R1_Chr3-1g06170 [Microbotryum saponariae]|uniref:BZ3500_MvSof-1268-A1-R1_Chr3-1g06170 protein n=1 Tax=Microbotryum saponariae TaxID=289078 RepID=A0A2X0KZH2_9BASI|nr:BZ3500_MvSof-1268-A1-R1_Chr3-1g06170 [Microbotryum saponariae]SDA04041.1 BZ3501_MvSof-1269-A2-R1_Chr3-2g05855 [Microbotryum saponariae]
MVGPYTFLSALALSSLAAALPTSERRTDGQAQCDLRFDKRLQFVNGVFRTTVFTDLHYGEAQGTDWQPWGIEQDINSTLVMDTVLQAEKPHLVVFNGDQVTGEGLLAENATLAYDRCLEATVNSRLPFAAIYGNHDNSVNISHTKLYQHEKSNYRRWSMTQANPDSANDQNGIYNYVLPVFENNAATSPSLLLWFFDSRSGIFDDPAQYEDWVDPKVSSWIKSTADCILSTYNLRSLPPSLTFVHIPVSRMNQLKDADVNRRPASYRPAFINDDTVNSQGEHHPAVHSPDATFWNAVRYTLNGAHENGVIATVVGHDHGNDWCAKSSTRPWQHCFARHSGYGGYGSWTRGSRVIEVRSGLNRKNETQALVANSWIRLETGDKTSESMLWKA